MKAILRLDQKMMIERKNGRVDGKGRSGLPESSSDLVIRYKKRPMENRPASVLSWFGHFQGMREFAEFPLSEALRYIRILMAGLTVFPASSAFPAVTVPSVQTRRRCPGFRPLSLSHQGENPLVPIKGSSSLRTRGLPDIW